MQKDGKTDIAEVPTSDDQLAATAGAHITAISRHGVDSRRHVPDGLGQALSGGAAGAPRDRRRLLDGSRAGDQRALRAIRRGDRPRDVRRDPAESRGLSRARCPTCCTPARSCSSSRPGPVDLRDFTQLVAVRCAAPTGGIRTGRTARSTGSSEHPVVHVAFADAEAFARVGGQGAADRGRMGVRRARRARRRRLRLGRRVPARRPAHGQHLAGRVPVAEHAERRLRGHVAGRRVSRRTATGSTT